MATNVSNAALSNLLFAQWEPTVQSLNQIFAVPVPKAHLRSNEELKTTLSVKNVHQAAFAMYKVLVTSLAHHRVRMALFVLREQEQKVRYRVRKGTIVRPKPPMPPCLIISVSRDFSVILLQGTPQRRKTIVHRLITVHLARENTTTRFFLTITLIGEETPQRDVLKVRVTITQILKSKCLNAT